MRIIFTYLIIVLFSCGVYATEYLVSTAAEINSSMNIAQPGDTLTMINGTWTNQYIRFSGDGAEGDSILLRAEAPGFVVLNGSSRLKIDGTYLKVDGLRFVGGYNTDSAIEFATGSRHCRVTNTQVSEFNPPREATRYHWIIVNGVHNRLDHCFFSGKRHSGVTVLVRLRETPHGYHRIDHNHFGVKPTGNGNGYETLKVSSGDYSDLQGNIIAEYNYFYHCNGEIEIISNKCHNNIYRYNTFVECQGTLTLRQGTNCVVEGNYFFGNNGYNTGGIRITHRGHKILNNYFQDLNGDGQRSAITLYAGMDHTDYVPGDGGHVRADSITIVHNTIVNCAEGIYSGAWDKDDPIVLPPKDNIFANNIITMDNTAKCYAHDPNHAGLNEFWEGNLLFGARLGDVPDSGYVVDDPALSLINGWYQISAQSPAIDASVGEYSDVIEDIDGIVRDSQKDIGADEFGSGSRQPLTSADVGPDWIKDSKLPRILSINMTGDGTGEVVLEPPGGIYEEGTTVTLTAIPDEDNSFAGWSGDIENTYNPIIITMDSDKIVNANFMPPVRYNLAVWKIGSGTVVFDPDGGSYPESTLVKIEAIPAEGWLFSHWGGELASTNNPDSVLMDSNKALTVTFSQAVGVEAYNSRPMENRLSQNYPNPFNPTTTITFSLKKAGHTTLFVYDILGHKVTEIVNRHLNAGHHQVEFDASGLASGVYFYMIKTSNFESQQKMILMR